MRSFYQDRLRTNVGKKQTVFLQVFLYQRTDNRTTAELKQIADFAITNRRSFTAVSPTTYQVTAQGELEPWSDHGEVFAAQFIAHGLRVLPLIWADCAAHPRPMAAFRKIMAQPASFIAVAVERAQKHKFGGFVLDWEPTGALTLEDMAAFPRFIDTFAAAMHAASPPLELHVFAGWVRELFQPIECNCGLAFCGVPGAFCVFGQNLTPFSFNLLRSRCTNQRSSTAYRGVRTGSIIQWTAIPLQTFSKLG
eukprot:COSAG02_NODE_5239_length_4513_cov_2.268691_3_plen_251_part_00